MPPLAPRAWSTGTGLHSTRACSELSTPFQTATFTASRMLSNSTRLVFAGWLSDLPPIQALCTLTYVGARTSRRLHLVMQGRISVQKYLSIFTLHDVTAKLTALSKSCWICIYSITNGSVELRMLHCGGRCRDETYFAPVPGRGQNPLQCCQCCFSKLPFTAM